VSANLDVVRSIYADWERGDFSHAEWAHPDIEYVIADGPAPGSWIGVAAMSAAHREWLNAWADFRSEVDEYRELDNGRTLALTHRSGRGRTSGVEVALRGAVLFEIHNDKVTRLVLYTDRDRALADLGLEQ
jgi:ketosteroid isomerase-like protein